MRRRVRPQRVWLTSWHTYTHTHIHPYITMTLPRSPLCGERVKKAKRTCCLGWKVWGEWRGERWEWRMERWEWRQAEQNDKKISIWADTRSPYNGERGNAIVMYGCVCVCHEVSQTRCGRTLRRTTFVFGSYERSIPLVWGGVKSIAVSRDLDLFI